LAKVQSVGRDYAHFLLVGGKPRHGIFTFIKAIKVLNSSSEQVSSLHTQAAKLCLKAKCYQHALKFIEHPITSVMKGTNPIEIMTYNYYRGMIYTGLKNYNRAIEVFSKVLTQPTKLLH